LRTSTRNMPKYSLGPLSLSEIFPWLRQPIEKAAVDMQASHPRLETRSRAGRFMQQYDVTLKLLLQHSAATISELIGSAAGKWLDTETPKVQNRRLALMC